MMEDELVRTEDRVVLAESRVVEVEAELQNIGENQKQLEVSEEKARQREEKYQGDIIIMVKMSCFTFPGANQDHPQQGEGHRGQV